MRNLTRIMAVTVVVLGGPLVAPTERTALAMSPAAVSAIPARCNRYTPLFRAHHLPVATFKRIAWRESGCNPRSFVIDRDDAGGGLLGINLKGRMAGTWRRWCGATLANITSADVNVRCAAVAYRKMGLRPWR